MATNEEIQEVEELLHERFPDGYILFHKRGRSADFKLSEFAFWIEVLKEAVLEHISVHRWIEGEEGDEMHTTITLEGLS